MGWNSTGAVVKVSKQTSSSLLFCATGQTPIYQKETIVTTETRGLDEDSALALVAAATGDDTTVEIEYYAHFKGRTYSFSAIVSGSRKEKGAARRDESGQWVYTETEHTFSTTTIPATWGTTPLDADGNPIALSPSGVSVVVNKERTVARIAWDVSQTVVTTVSEIRYVDSQASAIALVTANSTSNVDMATVSRYQYLSLSSSPTAQTQLMATAWVTYTSGTEKVASARYCGAADGWTVSITEKEYGWSSPTASQYGEGWR